MKNKNINKKIFAFAGFLAMMPFGATFAENTVGPYTDHVSVEIKDNCQFLRSETAKHSPTTALAATPTASLVGGGSWDINDVFSGTVLNGGSYDDFASSSFHVVCNNLNGFEITVKTEALSGVNDAEEWAYVLYDDYDDESGSAWTLDSVFPNGSNLNKDLSADVVATQNEATTTDGEDFSINYSMKVSETQAAGTYTTNVVYSFAQLNSDNSNYFNNVSDDDLDDNNDDLSDSSSDSESVDDDGSENNNEVTGEVADNGTNTSANSDMSNVTYNSASGTTSRTTSGTASGTASGVTNYVTSGTSTSSSVSNGTTSSGTVSNSVETSDDATEESDEIAEANELSETLGSALGEVKYQDSENEDTDNTSLLIVGAIAVAVAGAGTYLYVNREEQSDAMIEC